MSSVQQDQSDVFDGILAVNEMSDAWFGFLKSTSECMREEAKCANGNTPEWRERECSSTNGHASVKSELSRLAVQDRVVSASCVCLCTRRSKYGTRRASHSVGPVGERIELLRTVIMEIAHGRRWLMMSQVVFTSVRSIQGGCAR